MGVNLQNLLSSQDIKLDELRGKTVAVDAYNILYQFLSTIRGYDGKPLMNSRGEVTSHIQGLFNRIGSLLEKNIRFAFVFDGEPPQLKKQVLSMRRERKQSAAQKYEDAEKDMDIEAMQKFARQTSVLTKDMAEEAKQVLRLLGLPIVQAPSEGEAQAAHMCNKGIVDCVASQDADALLFDAPIVIRNLSVSGRRKLPGKQQWVLVSPQCLVLRDVLEEMQLSLRQLTVLSMLIGTDYAPGGIKGIGPKKALQMVRSDLSVDASFDELGAFFEKTGWANQQSASWKEVLELFEQPSVVDDVSLQWTTIQYEELQKLLVDKYEFSDDRVKATLDKMKRELDKAAQTGLDAFFLV